MKFTEIPFHPTLQQNLDRIGYTELTPIQEKSIPHAMEGKDVTGLAQTGTGKTMAFLLPTLHRFLGLEIPKSPYALVLSPTRELTIQIGEEAKKLLQGTSFGVATIIGGTDYKSQDEALKNACVIVATPGRLMDFVKNQGLSLDPIQVVIADEADRMFDMGFVQDLKYIFHKCKNRQQCLLFSATLSFEVVRLASKYLQDPVEVHINPEKVITERIEQSLLHLGKEEKLPYLVNSILNDSIEGLGIIFTNFKMNIPRIISTLRQFGITATGLSSELDQKKRIRLLRDFKSGTYKYLVATDVASRGIDIENIDIVYNFDLPQDSENYVHRIGRTARAGRKGRSIAFCSEADYVELERIEQYLNSKLPVGSLNEDFLGFPMGNFNPVLVGESIPGEKRESSNNFKRDKKGNRREKKSSGFIPKPNLDREPREPRPNRKKTKPNEVRKSNPREEKIPVKETASLPNRRNLFDKSAVAAEIKKKPLWKKLLSWFHESW